jgi:hypothetical protein
LVDTQSVDPEEILAAAILEMEDIFGNGMELTIIFNPKYLTAVVTGVAIVDTGAPCV